MQNMLIKVGVNALALWIAAAVVSGIHLATGTTSWTSKVVTVVLVAVVFGLVNAVVKPIAKLLSFPAIMLTLGLFTFIVNAFMLQITEWISEAIDLSFRIDDFFWDAVMAALVITIVSMVLNFVLPDGE